jgi:hypothetical protein
MLEEVKVSKEAISCRQRRVENMRKAGRYILLAALVMLAVAGLALWWWTRYGGPSRPVRWGRGRFTVSERAYCEARVKRILRTWQQTWQTADSGRDGRLKPPYDVYLVIDTARRAVWIEDGGQILEASRAELPKQLTWKLYRDEGKRLAPLPDVTRFKCRGIEVGRFKGRGLYRSRFWPEMIWLVGRGQGNDRLGFYFNCHSRGSDPAYRTGDSQKKWPAPRLEEGVDYHPSIVVRADEYEQVRRVWAGAGAAESAARPEQQPVDPRQAAWSKVEPKLYQTIESQVNGLGFHLYSLEVEPGPGWSAAHAHVSAIRRDFASANRRNLWQRLFGGWQFADCYLKIDSLGDRLWYASTAPCRLSGARVLELEFLVSEGETVSPEEQSRRLAQGREKQHPTAPPASPWQVTLANGATIAVLGICKVTGEEPYWWGPDGRREPSVPEFYSESRPEAKELARRYEIVWLVDWPLRAFGATHFSWSVQSRGDPLPLSCPARDRYGELYRGSSVMENVQTGGSRQSRVIRCFYAGGIMCRAADPQTTFSLGLRIGQGYTEWVTFQNISLRPGEDPGFAIVLEGSTP